MNFIAHIGKNFAEFRCNNATSSICWITNNSYIHKLILIPYRRTDRQSLPQYELTDNIFPILLLKVIVLLKNDISTSLNNLNFVPDKNRLLNGI